MTTLHKPGRGMHLAIAGFSTLLVIAILAAMLPAAPVSAQSNCSKTHSVVSGETLSSIAAKYNISYLDLAQANDLKDPYTLYIGQSLCIPGTAAATATSGSSSSSSTSTASASNSKDPNFVIDIEGKFLTVSTGNFPTQSSFFVRASEDRFPNMKWDKLGSIRTKKSGDVVRTFLLPRDLRDSSLLTICVKNATTDDVLCKRFAITQ